MSGRVVPFAPAAFAAAIPPVAAFEGRRSSRRMLVAFVTGATLAVAGFLVAGTSGPGNAASETDVFSALFHAFNPPAASQYAPDIYAMPQGDGHAALELLVKRKQKRTGVAVQGKLDDATRGEILAAGQQPRRSVCVRLCDGFFFPVGPVGGNSSLASHEADCAGLCPDAQTALYIEPAGSDKIEEASSIKGAPYTALPVAFRHRQTSDNSCTCHRIIGANYSLLRDFTLRKGDSVMTARGFRVFQGANRLPYVQSNFTTLARASMPSAQRSALMAMERVALLPLKNVKDTLLLAPTRLTTAAYISAPRDNATGFAVSDQPIPN